MNRVFFEIYRTAKRLYDRPKRVEARRLKRRQHERLMRHLTAAGGLAVRTGPFAGMQYLGEASWSGYFPRLMGSYEEELHPLVERLVETRPDAVIDIGCAEGYYAVGMARRLPQARVYAFDTDARARSLCSRLSALNGVQERVVIGKRCRTRDLNRLVCSRTAVICDCEGGELHLLRPDRVPALRDSIILIEIHDVADTRISDALRERFAPSHHITLITSVARVPSRYPQLAGLSVEDSEFAVEEFRGRAMDWAYMEPRGSWPREPGNAR